MIVKLFGALLHLLHDEGAVHAHALRIHVDVAAGILQDLQRLLVQEEDADLLEDAHGAVVDALDRLPASSGSTGRSRFCGIVQGIWWMAAVPAR